MMPNPASSITEGYHANKAAVPRQEHTDRAQTTLKVARLQRRRILSTTAEDLNDHIRTDSPQLLEYADKDSAVFPANAPTFSPRRHHRKPRRWTQWKSLRR